MVEKRGNITSFHHTSFSHLLASLSQGPWLPPHAHLTESLFSLFQVGPYLEYRCKAEASQVVKAESGGGETTLDNRWGGVRRGGDHAGSGIGVWSEAKAR